jgi:hypothetical protein
VLHLPKLDTLSNSARTAQRVGSPHTGGVAAKRTFSLVLQRGANSLRVQPIIRRWKPTTIRWQPAEKLCPLDQTTVLTHVNRNS